MIKKPSLCLPPFRRDAKGWGTRSLAHPAKSKAWGHASRW